MLFVPIINSNSPRIKAMCNFISSFTLIDLLVSFVLWNQKQHFTILASIWCFLGKYDCHQTHIDHSSLAKTAFCCLHCCTGCRGPGLKRTGWYSATGSWSMGLSRHHRSAAVKRGSFIDLFSHHNLCTCSLVCPSPEFPQDPFPCFQLFKHRGILTARPSFLRLAPEVISRLSILVTGVARGIFGAPLLAKAESDPSLEATWTFPLYLLTRGALSKELLA